MDCKELVKLLKVLQKHGVIDYHSGDTQIKLVPQAQLSRSMGRLPTAASSFDPMEIIRDMERVKPRKSAVSVEEMMNRAADQIMPDRVKGAA
jgi:hypothetical protein